MPATLQPVTAWILQRFVGVDVMARRTVRQVVKLLQSLQRRTARMTTPLHTTLKRALTVGGREFVVTLTADTLKLTLKGKRNGVELSWKELVSGDAALAVALQASVGAFGIQEKKRARDNKAPRLSPKSKKRSLRRGHLG